MAEGEPETREQFEARIAEGRHYHDRADKGIIALSSAASTFAVEAMKAPALVNGGSAAAMLAFIGTGRQPVTADTILGLKLFGAGLLAAALVPGLSWVSQFAYLASADGAERIWHHPFVVAHRGYRWLGYGARVASVVLVLAAYVLAGLGMWRVSSGLVTLPAVQPPAPAAPAFMLPPPIK